MVDLENLFPFLPDLLTIWILKMLGHRQNIPRRSIQKQKTSKLCSNQCLCFGSSVLFLVSPDTPRFLFNKCSFLFLSMTKSSHQLLAHQEEQDRKKPRLLMKRISRWKSPDDHFDRDFCKKDLTLSRARCDNFRET